MQSEEEAKFLILFRLVFVPQVLQLFEHLAVGVVFLELGLQFFERYEELFHKPLIQFVSLVGMLYLFFQEAEQFVCLIDTCQVYVVVGELFPQLELRLLLFEFIQHVCADAVDQAVEVGEDMVALEDFASVEKQLLDDVSCLADVGDVFQFADGLLR